MQQDKCQKKYMQQVKCYPCNKSNVMTHKKHMQKSKCQEEYMQQAKCYHAINQVSWHMNTCNKPNVKRNTCSKSKVTH